MTSNTTLELQALREAAQTYRARYVHLDDFTYPPGTRIAVNLTLDFDTMLRRRFSHEPIMQLAKGEFGGRVGIWRLLELFESHEVKATLFTPGRICELLHGQRSRGRYSVLLGSRCRHPEQLTHVTLLLSF